MPVQDAAVDDVRAPVRSATAEEERLSEESLLNQAMERYVDGDEAAFDRLYVGLSPRLYGYLLHLVRDRSRAEDLLQVTFMRLHTARSSWARGARVLPWAVAIARNAAFDDLRARKRARVTVTSSGNLPELTAPEPDEGPDAAVSEALKSAIDRLPTAYREALLLTKELDMTMREAAGIAGTTETAMKLRVHRAYKRLRKELERAPNVDRGVP